MTVRNETSFAEQSPPRWKKLMARLADFEQAMTYHPHEHANANVSHLWHKIEKLETRVRELEGRDRRVA